MNRIAKTIIASSLQNRAFVRALACFAHPLTLLAIGVLLLNDHVLKQAHPSWLTGKLSDFAWLVFAPFFVALLFAWLIPRRGSQQEDRVGLLACLVCGLFFAMAKTFPIVHDFTVGVQSFLAGWRVDMHLDPSDLLTLPALLLSGYIWSRANQRSLAPGIVVLMVGGLATVATSPPIYTTGIACLSFNNGALTASTGMDGREISGEIRNFNNYIIRLESRDAGETWSNPSQIDVSDPASAPCKPHEQPWQIADAYQAGAYYRFVPEQSIQRSDDNGQTWRTDLDLSGLSSDLGLMFYKDKVYRLVQLDFIHPPANGPLDAVIDPQTGRLFVAMGISGILVRDPNRDWSWKPVSGYGIFEGNRWSILSAKLTSAFFVALILVLLVPATMIPYWRMPNPTLRLLIFVLIVPWGCWLFSNFFPAFPLYDGFTVVVISPLLGFAGLISLALLGMSLSFIGPLLRKIIVLLGLAAVIVPLCYLLPLALWVEGAISDYGLARTCALVLTGIALLVFCFSINRRMGRLEDHTIPDTSTLWQ